MKVRKQITNEEVNGLGNPSVCKRFVNITELCYHTGLGRNTAAHLAKTAGAARKVGRRTLYDLNQIDSYFDKQAE